MERKVALITGAGTGIGKGIAVELAKIGYNIGVNYNSSEQGALDTISRIEEVGGEGLLVRADVSDKEQVTQMVKAVVDRFGGIDVLVNNAAMQTNLSLRDYDEEKYDRVMNINLKGYFFCTQAVIPFMKAHRHGRIINISSVHGKRPTDFDTVYAMTKGGIKMLTRESAIELAKYGMTVNTIEPGAVDIGVKSGNPRPIVSKEAAVKMQRRSSKSQYPLGRVGKPQDVGHMVAYMVSDQTEFLSGASIRLDGASMLM